MAAGDQPYRTTKQRLAERIRANKVTPNSETDFCKSLRRCSGALTFAYDVASQALWYMIVGIPMVCTMIGYGGAPGKREKRTDTRISVAVVAPPGTYKDGIANFCRDTLKRAMSEIIIETMDPSHEEQLRGGIKVVTVELIVGSGTKQLPIVLPVPGILGDDFAYITEAKDLVTRPEYESQRRFIRQALNPYGENANPKRGTGQSYAHALWYFPPVVILLTFQPEELTEDWTASGFSRRFIAGVVQPDSALLDRIAHRSILGHLDPVKDMGVFDTIDKSVAQKLVQERLQAIAAKYWSRPYNRWTVDPKDPEALALADLVKQLQYYARLDAPITKDQYDRLKDAMGDLPMWLSRVDLEPTDEASRELDECWTIIVKGLEERGETAARWADLMKTTIMNLFWKLAGITAGSRLAERIEQQDVLACALDLVDFLDSALALALPAEGKSFKKTIQDDVVWACHLIAATGGEMRSSDAITAYNAEQATRSGWRLWNRVRRDLGQLGLVQPTVKGKGQDMKIILTQLGFSIGGMQVGESIGPPPPKVKTENQREEDQVW